MGLNGRIWNEKGLRVNLEKRKGPKCKMMRNKRILGITFLNKIPWIESIDLWIEGEWPVYG
jgi:hypothetical protein